MVGMLTPHGRHEHARCDFIAITDTDHGIGLVCIDHIFDAVGDEVAGGKGIKHAVMSHSYAVVNSDRVEFGGKAS